MRINHHFDGAIAFFCDNEGAVEHILLKFGCEQHVVHTPKEAADLIKKRIDEFVLAFKEVPSGHTHHAAGIGYLGKMPVQYAEKKIAPDSETTSPEP